MVALFTVSVMRPESAFWISLFCVNTYFRNIPNCGISLMVGATDEYGFRYTSALVRSYHHHSSYGIEDYRQPMDPNQLSGSLDQLHVDPVVPNRKRRPARAHHQLTPGSNVGHGQSINNSNNNNVGGFNSGVSVPMGSSLSGASMNLGQANYSAQFQQQQPVPQQGVLPSEEGDILSVPLKRYRAAQEYSNVSFKSFENALPPPSTTQVHCIDQGTATPKFARLTMYNVPTTESLRNSTRLPLGMTVRPFAPVDANEETIPEVDMLSLGGPLRCRRCRTYLNPHMKFTHEQQFICNICKVSNPVPVDYQVPIDISGKRLDYLQRPELCKGVVDFLVPNSYRVDENEEPGPMHFVFLIDVTASQDVVRTTTDAIRSIINELSYPAKVSIIAYDQKIYCFDLSDERCQVVIVSDLKDIFVPFYDGLFVDVNTQGQSIYDALNRIDDMFVEFKMPEAAFGSALKFAQEALSQVGGGKICATLSKLPTWGEGILAWGENKPLSCETFKCANNYYQKLADSCLSSYVGLDMFVFSSGSVDLINSANVTLRTSGTLKLYPNFVAERDEIEFTEDLKSSVLRTQGYQGQLKVRCSDGLQVSNYYGNVDTAFSREPVVPVLSSDWQFSVLFSYDGKLSSADDAHFQSAVLYTGVDGVRRVRVVNMCAAVTEDIRTVFAFADQDAVTDIIVKNCLHYFSKQNPIEIKNSTKTKLVDIFSQYRALAASSNLLPTQLVFPEGLNTLCAFINSFQKSRVFKSSISNNLCVYDFFQLNSLPLEKLMWKLYPVVIDLLTLDLEDSDSLKLPENSRASSESLKYGGACLIFNGVKLLLWLHSAVNPLLLDALFGVGSLDLVDPLLTILPELNTDISLKVRSIVDYWREVLKQETIAVHICRQGIDGNEFEVRELLVEDRALDKTESYLEFVGDVHKRIKSKIQNENIRQDAEYDDSTLSQRFIHF